jgi:hypothetical protein
MDDAEFERQKQRIRDLAQKWIGPLGLAWGTISMAYCRTRDEFDPSDAPSLSVDTTVAKCRTDWRYAQSTITWVLPNVAEQDDEKLELIFVHELMRIFLNEMRWYEHEGHGIDHEERVATTLAKAFLWLRDALTAPHRAADSRTNFDGSTHVTHTSTNSQVLSADGETLFRLVTINGVPCWQASTGRTFPVVAGAEDPPGDGNSGDGKGDPPKKDGADGNSTDDGDFDKDRAIGTIKKLRENEKTLKQQLKELETLKAKQKEREDAEKSEADRLKEQIADLESKATKAERELTETLNRTAIERAASKAGAADPEDIFRLLDPDDFERDDAGKVTNADDLVKDLLKRKPYLVGKTGSTNGVPATPRASGTGHDDKIEENKKKLAASGDYNPL